MDKDTATGIRLGMDSAAADFTGGAATPAVVLRMKIEHSRTSGIAAVTAAAHSDSRIENAVNATTG